MKYKNQNLRRNEKSWAKDRLTGESIVLFNYYFIFLYTTFVWDSVTNLKNLYYILNNIFTINAQKINYSAKWTNKKVRLGVGTGNEESLQYCLDPSFSSPTLQPRLVPYNEFKKFIRYLKRYLTTILRLNVRKINFSKQMGNNIRNSARKGQCKSLSRRLEATILFHFDDCFLYHRVKKFQSSYRN